MHKNLLLAVGITILFLGVAVAPLTQSIVIKESNLPISDGNTLYVGGTGPNNYTKIQDAIDDTNPGDTVFVYSYSSPYYENLVVNKSINLIGENRNTTNIETYEEEEYGVTISANGVTFNGFTIDNYGFFGALLINSCNNNITNNIISGVEGLGIELSNANTGNIILNNLFIYNWYISLQISDSCTDTIIMDNTFVDNWHDIAIDDDCHNTTIIGNSLLGTGCCAVIDISHSDNNTISDNVVSPSYDYGIELHSSNGNTVLNNTITSVGWLGILIEHSRDNIVMGNWVSHCVIGIFLEKSSNNKIVCNSILSSSNYGIKLVNSTLPSNDNTIHHNNFFNNTQNAYDECSNEWDNGYPSGGNYWDDYNGTDEDGDGIGDTPYNISGGDNQDRYPLIEPWGDNLFPIAKFTWTPSHPDPEESILFDASQSIDYDGNIILYEWDWDNDGVFDENHTSPTATHTFEEVGYYPVTLRVTDNDSLTDSKTKTVRVGNYPPYEPSNPIPPDGATNVSDGGLCWTGGDPDGDLVSYDVYFGNTTPPPMVVCNISGTIYCPGVIEFNTTYYWKIVAWDEHGASTEGPIWSFTTRDNQPPDTPEIEGKRRFKVGEGGEYPYTIYSKDPDGDDVCYLINWSDGTQEWIGPYESGAEIIINVTIPLEKGTYVLFKIKAKDIFGAESDWSILEIIVPRTKTTFNSLFLWILEQFPMLERLLSLIRVI